MHAAAQRSPAPGTPLTAGHTGRSGNGRFPHGQPDHTMRLPHQPRTVSTVPAATPHGSAPTPQPPTSATHRSTCHRCGCNRIVAAALRAAEESLAASVS